MDGVGVGLGERHLGAAEDTCDGESRDGPVLPESVYHCKPEPREPGQQRDRPPQHSLVDDVVVPMAQMHLGFTVPALSLSYATPVELAGAHGRVQAADVDTGSDFVQQAGGLETVDDDLLDTRTGFGATSGGLAGEAVEEAGGSCG